ncbi:MAG: zinc ribbon domain-containing protein [Candidatus Hodarchaeota archaeon]
MVKCSNCGEVVETTDIFCINCGFNLLTTSIVNKAKDVVSKPMDLNLDTITRYQELEKRIDSLSNIFGELEQQRSYLTHLNESLASEQQRLRTLEVKRKQEYHDVEKLEKISITSVLARIKGTKEQQLEKEKIEYFNVLNKEEAASKECQKLEILIKDTQQQVYQLEDLFRTKQKLEHELEELIHEVCEEVPDPIEDAVEQRLTSLDAKLTPLQNKRSRMLRAENHLQHAASDLQHALNSLNSASTASTWDTFFGGGLLVDSIKHSKMSDARNRVHSAHRAIDNALHEYPDIPTLRAGHVEELSFFWDGFMDNIFSDLSARGKIHRSRDSVRQALHDASNALNWLHHQLTQINQQFENLNQQIEETRKKLLKERKRMISEAIQKQKTTD